MPKSKTPPAGIPLAGSRLLLLLGLAALLGACEAETDVPEADTVTPEVVERYRTGAIVALQEVDSDIAALETAAEQADSAAAVAYNRLLEALRRERQQVQADLDALPNATADTFEAATDTLDQRIDRLGVRVERAPLELARDAAQFRQVALARLAALEAEVQEDPALQRAQGEFLQRRQQIEGELARLGAPEASFPQIRANVIRLFESLSDRLDALRASPDMPAAPADTLAVPLSPAE